MELDLGEDLKNLLSDFASISKSCKRVCSENESIKMMLNEEKTNSKDAVARLEKLEREVQNKQNLVETLQRQLEIVPELKLKIVRLKEENESLGKELEFKDAENERLKRKHLTDFASLKDEIEAVKAESQDEEQKRLKELEEFFRHLHETELASIEKRFLREKQVIVEEMKCAQLENQTLKAEHEEELEKMKIQITSLKSKTNQSSVNNLEVYKNKMLAMQEHYEQELQKLVGKKSTEPKIVQATGEGPKKVRFSIEDLSDDENQLDDVNEVQDIFSVASETLSKKTQFKSILKPSKKYNPIVEAWSKRNDAKITPASESVKSPKRDGEKAPTKKFKFSKVTSSVLGARSDFGSFSMASETRCEEDPGYYESISKTKESGSGTKRKLFSEPIGPQLID